MDYTKMTLGELLTHSNETIKRNAMSILKTLQKVESIEWYKKNTGKSPDCPHYINADKKYNPDGWKYCTQCKK
jgi:hypothetical protein